MSDFGKLKRALADIIDGLQSQKIMNRLGLAQERNIQKRTREGRDLNEKSFKSYSPKYAKRKLRQTAIPTHVVNLTFDDINGMMHSIDHVVFADLSGVELEFIDERKRKIAEYHNILGAGKSKVIREFWGVNEKEEKTLADLVEGEVNLILEKFDEG